MTGSKSARVPKAWEAFYTALTGVTDRFCTEHLNDEYADLARSAVAALCRKRPSPLAGGNPQTWACAILYALGQIDFLSDKSTTPHMTMADLCAHFGIAPSTGGNKAKLVRAALGMRQFDYKWTLPSRLADGTLPWLITVDGLVVDDLGLVADRSYEERDVDRDEDAGAVQTQRSRVVTIRESGPGAWGGAGGGGCGGWP